MENENIKLTVMLIPKSMQALSDAAERTSLSQTDTVNRAIQLYDFFTQNRQKGNRFLLVDQQEGEDRLLELDLL